MLYSVILALMGGVFLIFGLDFILAPNIFKCDRKTRACYFENRHIWSSQSKKEELCKLSDIVRAKVESKMGHEDIMYTTVLELKDGKTVPIFQSSSNIEAYHIREAKKINEFLHCPRGDLVIKEGGFIMGIVLLVFAVVFGGLAFSFSALFSPYIQ